MLLNLAKGIISATAFIALAINSVAPAAEPTDVPALKPANESTHTMIVEVTVPDHARLVWLTEELRANALACIPTPGVQKFQVTKQQLERIRTAGLDTKVIIDDAEWEFVVEKRRIEENNRRRGANWFADYKTLAQINARIDEYVTNYPALVTKLPVGTSNEGRTFYAMRISGPGSVKPAVLFNGCQHAREWISPMTCMYIADQLLANYATDSHVQQLVDGVEFYIIPVVNPDGYEYTWTNQRLWRKNRRNNGNGTFGVDLNRNWNVDWNGSGSTSTDPGSDTFVGTAPFSEPEADGLRKFFLDRPNIVASIDFHSYGQLLLEPYGYTTAPAPRQEMADELKVLMDTAIASAHGVNYTDGHACNILYCASGTASDWMHLRGSLGFAIELRNTNTFELPPSQIIPTGQENFAGILAMADFAYATPGANFVVAGGLPEILAPQTETVLNIDITSGYAGAVVNNTASLWWRTNSRGAFNESPMSFLGGTSYQTTLPAVACGQTLEYYFSIETVNGIVTTPNDAPTNTHASLSTEVMVTLNDNSETNIGWIASGSGAGVTSGQWERGVPVNDPSWQYDPATDGDGSGQCWLTQNANGNTDVDGGSVTLTSPVFDMSGASDYEWSVSYYYYLMMTDSAGVDRLLVEASDVNRASWRQVALHDTSSSSWQTHTITQQDLLDAGLTLTSTMQFRFTANDTNPQSIVEAGLDGLKISRTDCSTPAIPGDLVAPFGTVDVADLFTLLSNFGASGLGADLAPPMNVVDVNDLFILLANWG